MLTLEILDARVRERLGGDRSRLPELFETLEVFEQLKANGKPGDWFHFEPKTFDGEYLIATRHGYQVYHQERGSQTGVRDFESLRDAAHALFGMGSDSNFQRNFDDL